MACPVCGSCTVRKALMAPAIRRSAKGTVPTEGPTASAGTVASPKAAAPAPALLDDTTSIDDDRARQVRALAREMHAKLRASAENVGAAFPAEARRIHQGEEPKRSIYGTATQDEVRSLLEDGVGILPLPGLPDERN